MLVLSRKRNEQLVIGGDIIITVIDVRGDKVRLGIEAPASVPVHREEVFVAIQKEPHGCDKPPVSGSSNS
jgi:carbon storage regulator